MEEKKKIMTVTLQNKVDGSTVLSRPVSSIEMVVGLLQCVDENTNLLLSVC